MINITNKKTIYYKKPLILSLLIIFTIILSCSSDTENTPEDTDTPKKYEVSPEPSQCNRCRHFSFGIESEKTLNLYFTRKDYLLNVAKHKGSSIDDICLTNLQEVKEDIQRTLTSNTILDVRFVVGYFTSHDKVSMLHKATAYDGTSALCHYMVEIKEPIFNERQDCNICGYNS